MTTDSQTKPAVNGVSAAKLQELLDRTEIVDCIVRYSRGYDRNDAELMRGAFHPDGTFSIGDTSQKIEEVIAYTESQSATRVVAQHFLTNHRVEIDGDTAHAETYWMAAGFSTGNPDVTLLAGRYVDRLERRDEEWKIVVRWSVPEWVVVGQGHIEQWLAVGGAHGQRRDRTDPSYERPLKGPA